MQTIVLLDLIDMRGNRSISLGSSRRTFASPNLSSCRRISDLLPRLTTHSDNEILRAAAIVYYILVSCTGAQSCSAAGFRSWRTYSLIVVFCVVAA